MGLFGSVVCIEDEDTTALKTASSGTLSLRVGIIGRVGVCGWLFGGGGLNVGMERKWGGGWVDAVDESTPHRSALAIDTNMMEY